MLGALRSRACSELLLISCRSKVARCRPFATTVASTPESPSRVPPMPVRSANATGPADTHTVNHTLTFADSDPHKHRPGDEGKMFKMDEQELKTLFPETMAGGLQLILFGRRRDAGVQLREDKWFDGVLKKKPGIIIRKQATQIMSSLNCWAIQGRKDNNPRITTPGLLLDGAPGTGKSTILNHVVHWARKSGDWIVVFLPEPSHYVMGRGFFQREGKEGEFILHAAFAQEIMSNMLKSNAEKFSQLKVEGFLARDGETNVADAISKLLGKNIVKREEESMQTLQEVYAVLQKQTTFPLLIAVDEINALCGTSYYRDLNLKQVPCKNVAIAKMFSRFLDADLARGVVVGAATRTGLYANVPLPPFNRSPLQVGSLSRADVTHYLTYLYSVGELMTPISEELIDYLMFVTAGRARELEKLVASELFNLGQNNLPKNRKIGKWYKRNPGGMATLFEAPGIPTF